MGYATEQRQAFSDALLEAGASAPTLCEGWSAYDLAAHCWVRERRPKALLGIASKRVAHLAEAEMAAAKESMGFVEMATKLRERPTTPLTLLPGGDDLVNAAEYLIHTEDVRRANGMDRREIAPGLQVLLWRRLPLMGRALLAKAPVGVRLEWVGTDAEPIRAKAGASTVTIAGVPSEILLYLFGRKDAADVQLIGEEASVVALRRTKLGA